MMDWVDVIKAFTRPYDIVLDPFCGTGSVGEACMYLHRTYLGADKCMTRGERVFTHLRQGPAACCSLPYTRMD